MSWPRGSLFTALLVLSIPLASADTITVNTTTDDFADNSMCSLREAVEYFNLDKPLDGFQGCVAPSSNSSDSITVPANENPYLISSRMDASIDRGAIVIRRSVSINGGGIASTNRTLLQVVGAHRAFVISGNGTVQAPDCSLTVTGLCNPAGAPVLDAASDTSSGTDVTGDFLTSDNTPKVIVDVGTVPPATTYTVRLYSMPFGSPEDAEPKQVGVLTVTNSTPIADRNITTATLAEGIHDLTYTITANDGDEGPHSPALRLGIYYTTADAISVDIGQMEIQGCVTTAVTDCANDVDGTLSSTSANGLESDYALTGTAGKGGVIYTEEGLSLNTVILHDGAAVVAPSQGGAIWGGDDVVLEVVLTQFRNNSAAKGAAIYSSKNSLGVSQSLFTENTTTDPAGAVVNVADEESPSGTAGASQISDSTFSGNDGVALLLREGSFVTGSTIVLNQGGINFFDQKVSVYNTILAGNPDSFPYAATATDCQNLPAAASSIDFKSSLGVLGGGCDGVPSGLRLLKNDNVGTAAAAEKLMAQADAGGKCVGYVPEVIPGQDLDDFAGMGLLCPLAAHNEEDDEIVSATHLPRLLDVYTSVGDSPIIAKGSSSNSTADACSGNDQRGKTRHDVCDIGAAELQPITGTLLSGDAISYGQTYTEALDSNLDDETLFLPSATRPCPAFALTDPADVLVPGCPWITVQPSKGRVVFNADGSYTYIPNGNFHGFDRFSFRVVTTLSKLNSDVDQQSRLVNAQIIMEPSNGISAYSTSGSADIWYLLLLSGLGLGSWRRMRGHK